ncbi:MAG: peptidyl-prolyl cis-trans isomerase, partial [Rectinema sp.]
VFVEPKVYARQRLLFQAYVQTKKAAELKLATVEPTADEILKAYDLAKSSLLMPDTMRVSILYVDIRGKSDADIKKARETINGLAATLKINPGKFDELNLRAGDAAGYKSIPNLYLEKTTENRTTFGPELFDAVFKLKAGDISPVIESSTGYRIVRANEFMAQKQLSLSDTVPGNQNVTIQQYIAYQVAVGKQSDLMDKLETELITQLRKEATIKVYEENLVF